MKYKLRVLKPKEIKLNIDFEMEKSIKIRDMIVVTAPDNVLTTNFAREFMEVFKTKYPNVSLLLLPKDVEILELEEINNDEESSIDKDSNNNNVGC